MLGYDIKRGVGKSPEIFGLSEKYLGYLAGGLILGFVAFGLCRLLVSSNLIGILVLFATVGGSFFYCQHLSLTHGDHGLEKLSAYRRRPRIVASASRAVFLQLQTSRP
jgi:hypothetical protein